MADYLGDKHDAKVLCAVSHQINRPAGHRQRHTFAVKLIRALSSSAARRYVGRWRDQHY
jgi:hypothetical protein